MKKTKLNYEMYILSMVVPYPKDTNFDDNWLPSYEDTIIDRDFMEKELSKILPKNILSGGYICPRCGTYLCYQPSTVCEACFEYELEVMEKSKSDNKEWDIDHVNNRIRTLDFVFATSTDSKCELTQDDFSKLENIKDLSFGKTIESDYESLEAQYIIKFDGGKFIFTDVPNEEIKDY